MVSHLSIHFCNNQLICTGGYFLKNILCYFGCCCCSINGRLWGSSKEPSISDFSPPGWCCAELRSHCCVEARRRFPESWKVCDPRLICTHPGMLWTNSARRCPEPTMATCLTAFAVCWTRHWQSCRRLCSVAPHRMRHPVAGDIVAPMIAIVVFGVVAFVVAELVVVVLVAVDVENVGGANSGYGLTDDWQCSALYSMAA